MLKRNAESWNACSWRTAVDRLVQLRSKAAAGSAELRRKKGEIDRLRARYEQLYERKQPIRDAVEMAKLAERLRPRPSQSDRANACPRRSG